MTHRLPLEYLAESKTSSIQAERLCWLMPSITPVWSLADKISKLHIFFSLLKTNITEEEKQYLDPALVECYRRFGITFDNTSLHDEDGGLKPMPDLHDLYDLLREQPETKSLAVALARFG